MPKTITDRNETCHVTLCSAFYRAPFLAGIPPLAEWLRSNLRRVYGDEKMGEIRDAYQHLVDAYDGVAADVFPIYGSAQCSTTARYKRDRRNYNITFQFNEGWASPAKIGEKYLTPAEALMLRDDMVGGVFVPEEQDGAQKFVTNTVEDCPEMQLWCEIAHNHVEAALEYTLYLYQVRKRLRLPSKWTSGHVLATINPEWGVKHRCGGLLGEVTQRQWSNATSIATNAAIHRMLDDMTLIEHGVGELPFLRVEAKMDTLHEEPYAAPHTHVIVE